MSENLKPLSIKQLIDKLNLIMKEFDVSENDYVFFTPVGEDEVNVSALTPVFNVSCQAIVSDKDSILPNIHNCNSKF
jgi:hypothetical protein